MSGHVTCQELLRPKNKFDFRFYVPIKKQINADILPIENNQVVNNRVKICLIPAVSYQLLIPIRHVG